jgi:hypothetical protein
MAEKILCEFRKQVGDFDVLDVADMKRADALRGQLDVDVPLDLHWTWNYAGEVEELRNLYERGKKGQWNAETDIDWDMPFPRDEWFLPKKNVQLMPSLLAEAGVDDEICREAAWDEFSHLLSQLLHGEQAALQLCGQLTNSCPTLDAKFYAGSQVIDEVRHVEVISKFLLRKVGTLHPIDPTLKVLLDMLLQAPNWKTKTLGMQTLFEGMAVGIFDEIARSTTNPLLRDIVRRVQVDEARHAAFGVLSMRQVVRESEPEELEQMEDFAFSILEALNANQQMDMLHRFGAKYGLDPDAVVEMMLGLPDWPLINSRIYMHTVVPNLKRLGLITERTEERYRQIGILHDQPYGV